MYKKRENHSIFTTSESRVNLVGNWDFGICLGWFWCSKISKKNGFDQKESVFGKLETFLQHIREYRRKKNSREKDFFCDSAGWTRFKDIRKTKKI